MIDEKINRIILLNAFPKEIQKDVDIVVQFLSNKNLRIHPQLNMPVVINNEIITIPCRIYSDEPSLNSENRLTKNQNVILNCLYLTHSNGYLRQKRLEMLKDNFEDFVIPYKMKVLSEYVVEIIADIESQINEKTIESYLRFISKNPKYWSFVKSRIVSYWSAYYSYHYKLKDYVGYKIIQKIEVESQQNKSLNVEKNKS